MLRERDIDQLPSIHAPTKNETHNPGMCTDLEINQQHFEAQENAQSTEPLWPGGG